VRDHVYEHAGLQSAEQFTGPILSTILRVYFEVVGVIDTVSGPSVTNLKK